jgi:hypothetical protein
MAQRTGHAQAGQSIDPVDRLDRALEAHHGVEFQQRDRGRGALEIDRAAANAFHHRRRQGLGVHLQTDRERDGRVYRGLDHLVQPQRVRPLRFVAEGVVAKNLLALLQQRLVAATVMVRAAAGGHGQRHGGQSQCQAMVRVKQRHGELLEKWVRDLRSSNGRRRTPPCFLFHAGDVGARSAAPDCRRVLSDGSDCPPHDKPEVTGQGVVKATV